MGGWNMNFKKILMVIFMILGLGLAQAAAEVLHLRRLQNRLRSSRLVFPARRC